MSHWALPALAVMLIAYGAVSGRLRSTPVSQAMVFVTLGLLVGNRALTCSGWVPTRRSFATWPKPP